MDNVEKKDVRFTGTHGAADGKVLMLFVPQLHALVEAAVTGRVDGLGGWGKMIAREIAEDVTRDALRVNTDNNLFFLAELRNGRRDIMAENEYNNRQVPQP